ncbi:hypothetical protein HMPREF0833_10560 [Streptococcus parasanguinis ATCC 15912]|uniref:Uncharacterized protein n=1 Tax=Streptococcus parasanguinis (strain ATCC 15912 / DSM 6778 / CIP 104372 / LMG 14537) TaxID=760570 RepID=F8DHA6_STREP|nr:hypothetical protein HMPREF0833_10560 [Streptococcus parasanguinis ATCC 15912]
MALLIQFNLIYNNSMPYFYKNKDKRKNIVILGIEMLFLFLQKNGIIIV